MKPRIAVFLSVTLILLAMCVPAVAIANGSTEISLSLSKTTASVGESITASGTTAPGAWVPLKVIDGAQNILVFDAKKADANGNYRLDFIVPASASGTLTIVVGEGGNVVAKTLTVKSAGGGDGGGGGTSPVSQPETGAKKTITAATGGTVSYENLTVEIPAGALPGNATVSISKLASGKAKEAVPEGLRVKLCSDVYEITTTGSRDFGDKTITIKIAYDPSKIAAGETSVIQYYDEAAGKWMALETTVVQENGKWYAVTQVNHLTRFAVFSAAVRKVPGQPAAKVIKLTVGQVEASVDGSPYILDAAPYVDPQAGRALAPVRFISEALGAGVDWDIKTGQVTITDGGKEIVLTLGSREVWINGGKQTIDCVPALLPPGRTFTPLRFVSETLGAKVDYEAQTREITITR